jgi:DNA-binding PadR family transcriptional regulator
MTNAELAILSLVAERPRHGYEIEQVIDQRGMRDWTEVGFSSIYYILKKLEQYGFVSGELVEAGRGPARRVYQATSAGIEAYHAAVLDSLSAPRRSYPSLLLGLASLPSVPPPEARSALRKYRNGLVARRSDVQANWDRQKPLPDHVDAMFAHSLAMIRAELGWLDGFLTKLEDAHDQD